jgi:hypothetical protein
MVPSRKYLLQMVIRLFLTVELLYSNNNGFLAEHLKASQKNLICSVGSIQTVLCEISPAVCATKQQIITKTSLTPQSPAAPTHV